ncbi:MAG: hypothetical protein ACI4QT_00430 [Kiritimatiellia bacterium]
MSIKKLWKSFWNWLKAELVADVSDRIDIDGDKPEMEATECVSFADLRWDYGGFDGSQASPVDGVEIALDSVTSSGLRYRYLDGSLLALSPENTHENPDCLACLFCLIDGVWRGGKFDWISSDRLTRDFANIRSGYHGWPPGAIRQAESFAFVIVSSVGKLRTNVAVKNKSFH